MSGGDGGDSPSVILIVPARAATKWVLHTHVWVD